MRIRETRFAIVLTTLVAAALFGACGGGGGTGTGTGAEGETPMEEAAGGTLEFAGTEYAFSVDSPAPAGQTEVTLVNNGDEPHMLDLVPLTDDAPPVDELIRLPDRKVEKLFTGQPIHLHPVQPGETSKPAKAMLQPGRYGYVCFFSKKGEKPHAFQGMFGEL